MSDQPKLFWSKWSHADWLRGGTRFSMTAAERGIFRDARDLCCMDGSIPADRATLIRMLAITPQEFEAAWPRVSQEFVPHADLPGRLINLDAQLCIEEAQNYLERQRKNGQRGGRPRKTLPAKPLKRNEKNPTLLSGLRKTAKIKTQPKPIQQSNSRNSRTVEQKTETETLKARPTANARAHEDAPLSFSEPTDDDRPTADAGPSRRWKPSEAEAARLARLMAESTGKTDECFASGILELAADGSAQSYAEVEACVRDATEHATSPPRSNGFFETVVQREFAPDAPRLHKRAITTVASALRMDRRRPNAETAAERQARIERNRQQAEGLKSVASDEEYRKWQRLNEPRTSQRR